MPNELAQKILEKRDRAVKEIEARKKEELKVSVQKDVGKSVTNIFTNMDGYDGAVMLFGLQAEVPDEREKMILDGISERLGVNLRTLTTLEVTDMNRDSNGRNEWYWTVRTVELVEALQKS